MISNGQAFHKENLVYAKPVAAKNKKKLFINIFKSRNQIFQRLTLKMTTKLLITFPVKTIMQNFHQFV